MNRSLQPVGEFTALSQSSVSRPSRHWLGKRRLLRNLYYNPPCWLVNCSLID